jgi:choline dehydrogenase-like flavoprotein
MQPLIVIPGGPAGATLGSRLASSKAAPEVLLLEAGARNDDPEATRLSERQAHPPHKQSDSLTKHPATLLLLNFRSTTGVICRSLKST